MWKYNFSSDRKWLRWAWSHVKDRTGICRFTRQRDASIFYFDVSPTHGVKSGYHGGRIDWETITRVARDRYRPVEEGPDFWPRILVLVLVNSSFVPTLYIFRAGSFFSNYFRNETDNAFLALGLHLFFSTRIFRESVFDSPRIENFLERLCRNDSSSPCTFSGKTGSWIIKLVGSDDSREFEMSEKSVIHTCDCFFSFLFPLVRW